jgi:hypothetical protein
VPWRAPTVDVPRVALTEVSPAQQRNLHRLEISGRDGVHERLHVLAVGGLVAFHAIELSHSSPDRIGTAASPLT